MKMSNRTSRNIRRKPMAEPLLLPTKAQDNSTMAKSKELKAPFYNEDTGKRHRRREQQAR